MCTPLWPRPLKCEVSGPHFKRDTRPKLYRVKWTRRMCFNVYIAVQTVPLTFQQRIQGLDEAIHIKHKSYCIHSALLDYSSIDGPKYDWGQVPEFAHRRDKSSFHFSTAYSRAR